MKVIDLTTRTRDPRVHVDGSPAYDFLAALYVTQNALDDHGFEVDRDWIARARAALPGRVREDLRLFFQQRSVGVALVGLLDPPGSTASVAEFLARVEATPAEDLVRALLVTSRASRPLRSVLDRLLQSAGSDRERLIEEFIAALPEEANAAAAREVVEQYPEEIRQRLMRLLRAFYRRVYQAEEARILPLLGADVEEKRRHGELVAPAVLIERATGGYVLEGGASEVVLAPSFFSRPYNVITGYEGVRVFIYPAVSGDPEERLRALARAHKAFADETRLRILHMLADGDLITQEIANRLGVSHVTALHHLAQLRAAYLIRIVERGGQKFNSLRPEGIAGAEADLRAFLGLDRLEHERATGPRDRAPAHVGDA